MAIMTLAHTTVMLLFAMAAAVAGAGVPAAQRRAGILYEVWHAGAATMMAQVAAKGAPQLTTELVIQSNGTLTLDDVYIKPLGSEGDIWNVQPQLGFCLYGREGGREGREAFSSAHTCRYDLPPIDLDPVDRSG